MSHLRLIDGTEGLFRNVGTELPVHAALNPRREQISFHRGGNLKLGVLFIIYCLLFIAYYLLLVGTYSYVLNTEQLVSMLCETFGLNVPLLICATHGSFSLL